MSNTLVRDFLAQSEYPSTVTDLTTNLGRLLQRDQTKTGSGSKKWQRLFANSYAKQVLLDGAVAYWRLGETSGTAATDLVGTWPATIAAAVAKNQRGALPDGDAAMLFDGATGTFVETNAVFSQAIGTGPLTLECWLKTSDAGSNQGIIDNKDSGANTAGFNLSMANGTLVFKVANGAAQAGIATPGTFNDGQWHHVVGTLTRGTPDVLTIYVDGASKNSTNPAADGWNVTAGIKLRIGSYTNAGNPNIIAGTIDEVAVYAVALSPTQVAAHFALRP